MPAFGFGAVDPARLAGMLRPGEPLSWDVAREVARAVAEAGAIGPPPGTGVVRELTDVMVSAAAPVAAETGLGAVTGFTPEVWTRPRCAEHQLDALREVLEALARRLRDALGPGPETGEEATEVLAGLPVGTLVALAPLLLGAQAGAMVGFLAQRTLGRYDLPLPFSGPAGVAIVGSNVEQFARDWSLARTDLAFHLAVGELVRAAQRSVPWLRSHLVRLAVEAVSAYELDEDRIGERLGDLDPSDPETIARLAEHPGELLGAMTSDRQQRLLGEIRRAASVLEGHAWVIRERIGARMLPGSDRIEEALRRHHVEAGEAGRFVEHLLGLRLNAADYERGRAFAAGVVDRAGPEALNALYEDPSRLPTEPEIDAPGLWLARIEL